MCCRARAAFLSSWPASKRSGSILISNVANHFVIHILHFVSYGAFFRFRNWWIRWPQSSARGAWILRACGWYTLAAELISVFWSMGNIRVFGTYQLHRLRVAERIISVFICGVLRCRSTEHYLQNSSGECSISVLPARAR